MKTISLALLCMFVLVGCAPTYGYGYHRDYNHFSYWDRPLHTQHVR